MLNNDNIPSILNHFQRNSIEGQLDILQARQNIGFGRCLEDGVHRLLREESAEMRSLIPKAYEALINNDEVKKLTGNNYYALMQFICTNEIDSDSSKKLRDAINIVLLNVASKVCNLPGAQGCLALRLKQQLAKIIGSGGGHNQSSAIKHKVLIELSTQEWAPSRTSDNARLEILLKSIDDDERFSNLLKPMIYRLKKEEFNNEDEIALKSICEKINQCLKNDPLHHIDDLKKKLKSGSLIEGHLDLQKKITDVLKIGRTEDNLKTLVKLDALVHYFSGKKIDYELYDLVQHDLENAINTAGVERRMRLLSDKELMVLAFDETHTKAIRDAFVEMEENPDVNSKHQMAHDFCKKFVKSHYSVKKSSSPGQILAWLMKTERFGLSGESPEKSYAKLCMLNAALLALPTKSELDLKRDSALEQADKLESTIDAVKNFFGNINNITRIDSDTAKKIDEFKDKITEIRNLTKKENTADQLTKVVTKLDKQAEIVVSLLDSIINNAKLTSTENLEPLRALRSILHVRLQMKWAQKYRENLTQNKATLGPAASASAAVSEESRWSLAGGGYVGTPSVTFGNNGGFGIFSARFEVMGFVESKKLLSIGKSREGGIKFSFSNSFARGMEEKLLANVGGLSENTKGSGLSFGVKAVGSSRQTWSSSKSAVALVANDPFEKLLPMSMALRGGEIPHNNRIGSVLNQNAMSPYAPRNLNLSEEEVINADYLSKNFEKFYPSLYLILKEAELEDMLIVPPIPQCQSADVVWTGLEDTSAFKMTSTAQFGPEAPGIALVGDLEYESSTSTVKRNVITPKPLFSVSTAGNNDGLERRVRDFFNVPKDRSIVLQLATPIIHAINRNLDVGQFFERASNLNSHRESTNNQGNPIQELDSFESFDAKNLTELKEKTISSLNTLNKYFLLEKFPDSRKHLKTEADEAANYLDQMYKTKFSPLSDDYTLRPSKKPKIIEDSKGFYSKQYLDFCSIATTIEQLFEAITAYYSLSQDSSKSTQQIKLALNMQPSMPLDIGLALKASTRPYRSGYDSLSSEDKYTSKEKTVTYAKGISLTTSRIGANFVDPNTYMKPEIDKNNIPPTLGNKGANAIYPKVSPLQNPIVKQKSLIATKTSKTAIIYPQENGAIKHGATNYALNYGDLTKHTKITPCILPRVDSVADFLRITFGIQTSNLDTREEKTVRVIKDAKLFSDISLSLTNSESNAIAAQATIPLSGIGGISVKGSVNSTQEAPIFSVSALGNDPSAIATTYKVALQHLRNLAKIGIDQALDYLKNNKDFLTLLMGYPSIDHISSMLICYSIAEKISTHVVQPDSLKAGFVGDIAQNHPAIYQAAKAASANILPLANLNGIEDILNNPINSLQLNDASIPPEFKERLNYFLNKNSGKSFQDAMSAADPEIKKAVYLHTDIGKDLIYKYLKVSDFFEKINVIATAHLSWQTGYTGYNNQNNVFARGCGNRPLEAKA